jgi:hypothetical protein
MKNYILILIAFIAFSSNAQISQVQNIKGQVLITDGSVVGIGATNEPCALLQLDALEKGLLIPRMAGANAEAMQPVAGIIVYINDGDGVVITEKGFWGYTNITDIFGNTGSWVKLHL